MMKLQSCLVTVAAVGSFLLAGCTPSPAPETPAAATPQGPDTPVRSDDAAPSAASAPLPGAVQCAPTQFVAQGQCFDAPEAACAALSCPSGCLNLETAPAQVVCGTASTDAVEPAPVACGGYGNTACPDGLVCIDDPSDDCAPPRGFDCGGICVEPDEAP